MTREAQRADARRSARLVLEAAERILADRPEAGLEDIARVAGVSRQTVYAHFPSRRALVQAVLDRITGEAAASIDRAEPERGPATGAVVRLIDASWTMLERYPLLLSPGISSADGEGDRERHAPVFERLEALLRRGQAAGEFDPDLSPSWFLSATVALGHAAGGEVRDGRMKSDQARLAFRAAVLRILGAGRASGTEDMPPTHRS